MKYCIHCGTQLADDAKFCSTCGATSQPASPAPQAAPQAPAYDAIVPASPTTLATPPVIKDSGSVGTYLKQAATSPLVIIYAILNSILLLINLFWTPDLMEALGPELAGSLNTATSSAYKVGFWVGNFISQVPMVLMVIGIWITVGSAAKNSQLRNAAGVNLIKGLYKVLRILYPIVFGLFSFVLVAACTKLNNPYYSSAAVHSVQMVYAIVLFILWGAAGFSIFYYSKIISTLEAISSSITYGKAFPDISMFVIVMSFIGGGFSTLSMLGSSGVTLLLNALSAAVSVLGAVILIILRSNLERLAYSRRAETAKSAGGWLCTCGRVNPDYVSTCICGRNNNAATADYSANVATARWECKNCYSTNPPSAKLCTRCGARKTEMPATPSVPAGNWRCSCGRVNPSFVSSCSCGQSKYRL